VDGVIYSFKIIEEWGFSLGEDACLLDDDDTQEEVNSDMEAVHDNVGDGGDVQELLNNLFDKWNKEVNQQKVVSRFSEDNVVDLNVEKFQEECSGAKAAHKSSSAIPTPREMQSNHHKATPSSLEKVTSEMDISAPSDNLLVDSEPVSECGGIGNTVFFLNDVKKRGAKRTTSCPPGRGRSLKAGP